MTIFYDTTTTQVSYEHTHEGLAVPTGLGSPWVICDYSGVTVSPSTSIIVDTSISLSLMTVFDCSTVYPWGRALAHRLPSLSGQDNLPLQRLGSVIPVGDADTGSTVSPGPLRVLREASRIP